MKIIGKFKTNYMFRQKYKIKDVFGQSRNSPLNYVERENVDQLLIDSLGSDQHIVIHGSSKQGKTSLRKHNLKEDEYILIHCSNVWDIGKLNAQILKQAGYELKVSRETTIEGNAKMSAKLKIPSLFEVGGESGLQTQDKEIYHSIELDVYDVNDIIDRLESINFNKYIILEDFHYLEEKTQRDFSFQLKAYHEMSNLTFIIIGVWLEENRLTLLNGDLTGRVASINADIWKLDELKDVVIQGEKLLNYHFTHPLKTEIIKHSLGSVFLLQEICKSVCLNLSLTETSNEKITIDKDSVNIFSITKKIILQQRGRYESFLRVFVTGKNDDYKDLYKWILLPIFEVNTDHLVRGISVKEISKIIDQNSCVKINPNQLIDMLNQLPTIQRIKNIKPIILDFDNNNLKLNIVDRGFMSWLIFQNKEQLKAKIFTENNL